LAAINSGARLRSAKVFAQNGASYTKAFSLKAFVIRQEGGFDLAVERSFGDMLEDYLGRINP
jgi:hypothetical protein